MALSFRPMQPEDVAAALDVRLSTVENAVTLEELHAEHGVTPQGLKDSLRAHSAGWVCEDAGQIVGFAIGDGETGEVKALAVRPSHENRGIGKTLLAHLTDWLISRGHRRLWLLANPDPAIRATGFYRRLGWQRAGKMKGGDEMLFLRAEGRPPERDTSRDRTGN